MTLHYVAPLGAGVLVPSALDVSVMRLIFNDPKAIRVTHYLLKKLYLFLPGSFNLPASGFVDQDPFNGPYNFSVKTGGKKYLRSLDIESDNGVNAAYFRCVGCPHEMLRLLGDTSCAMTASDASALSAEKISYNVLHHFCPMLSANEAWRKWLALKVSVVYGKEAIYHTDLYKSGPTEVKMIPSLKKWKAFLAETSLENGLTSDALDSLGKEGR